MGGPAPDSSWRSTALLILMQDLRAAARGEPASFEIHEELDFPGREAVAVQFSPQELAKQTPEANELALALFDIIRRSHSRVIDRTGAEL